MRARWGTQRFSASRQAMRICGLRVLLVWAEPESGSTDPQTPVEERFALAVGFAEGLRAIETAERRPSNSPFRWMACVLRSAAFTPL